MTKEAYKVKKAKDTGFTEIRGNISGDLHTFRVYKNGAVYER